MIDRRTILASALAVLTGPAITQTVRAQAAMTRVTAYAFSFPALAGGDIRLADYAGRPVLVVNTASLCGFTPQYAGLQQLWTEFHDRGLMIVGVPSNDFGAQEPGGATGILQTARHQYGVTFPLAAKAFVRGAKAHPFYKWAAGARPNDVPRWNFHKYLIGRDAISPRYSLKPSNPWTRGSRPRSRGRWLIADPTRQILQPTCRN